MRVGGVHEFVFVPWDIYLEARFVFTYCWSLLPTEIGLVFLAVEICFGLLLL